MNNITNEQIARYQNLLYGRMHKAHEVNGVKLSDLHDLLSEVLARREAMNEMEEALSAPRNY